MRKLTRLETLDILFTTLPDVTAISTGITPNRGNTDHIPMLSATYHEGTYKELERAYRQMRKRGYQEHLEWTDRNSKTHRDSLLSGYWQLGQWYLNVQWKAEPIYRTTKTKGGKNTRIHTGQYERIPIRHPQCRKEKVAAALEWISREFQGEPTLPKEIWQQAAA